MKCSSPVTQPIIQNANTLYLLITQKSRTTEVSMAVARPLLAGFVLVLSTYSLSAELHPEVTLPHGGILRGLQATWLNKTVTLFLGMVF